MTEYENAREHAALFDLSAHGKIELTGPDATKFLHNLCTNDILNLPVGSGCEAFFCTAKAKVVAHVFIFRAPHSFWIDSPPGTAAEVYKHLDHYLISEQVELADRTTEFAEFHLAGPEAQTVLSRAVNQAVPELADLQHTSLPLDGATCYVRRHSPLGLPGYDILCPRPQTKAVGQVLLDRGAHPVTAATYDVLRIEAGMPRFGVDIDTERFVVEVGRIKQAICYTKGCYLGQEPIVMARDRGHVNRTLRGVKLSGVGPVAAGARLLREGTEIGQVTSSVMSPRLGPIGLAYLRRGSESPGTAVEVEGGEQTGVIVALPFGEM